MSALSNDELLLLFMHRFFKKESHMATLKRLVANERKQISLRLIDWVITIYSKHCPIVYSKNGCLYNMHNSYRTSLRAYGKKRFDAFRRNSRIDFNGVTTTPGQLNFVRWAISTGVMDYLPEPHAALCHALDEYIKNNKQFSTKPKNYQRVHFTVKF